MGKFTDKQGDEQDTDKLSPHGKAKKPSKVSPTEKGGKKLKKGSMMEKIVKGYAKGAGSDRK